MSTCQREVAGQRPSNAFVAVCGWHSAQTTRAVLTSLEQQNQVATNCFENSATKRSVAFTPPSRRCLSEIARRNHSNEWRGAAPSILARSTVGHGVLEAVSPV